MRAWLFALAVLATFQPIIQVASTGASTHPTTTTSSTSLFYMSSQQHSDHHTSADIPKASPPVSSAYKTPSSSTQTTEVTENAESVQNTEEETTATVAAEIKEQETSDQMISTRSAAADSSTQQKKVRESPDPKTLAEIEGNLLQMFGFKERPQVDVKNIVIPEPMRQLYADIMGHELDSTSLPRPGLYSQTANTVRSFPHEGKNLLLSFNYS